MCDEKVDVMITSQNFNAAGTKMCAAATRPYKMYRNVIAVILLLQIFLHEKSMLFDAHNFLLCGSLVAIVLESKGFENILKCFVVLHQLRVVVSVAS